MSAGDSSKRLVIVPVFNEGRTIREVLCELCRNWGGEVLVVDDGSSDGTADAARAAGARVLASAPLPEGWRGKTWACHQGAADGVYHEDGVRIPGFGAWAD